MCDGFGREPGGGDVESRGEESRDDDGEGDSSEETEAGDEDASTGDDNGESLFAGPSRRNWDLSPPTEYKAFTTKFDEMVKDGRMPKPKRVDGRTVWDRIGLDAAFTDLPDGDSGNILDHLLSGKHRAA